jgi:hypothetical protein
VTVESREAEQSALGAVLLSDTALRVLVEEGLRPEDFYREQHGIAFAAMLELHNGREPVDALTLVEHLKQAGKLEDAGGRAAIDLLASSVPAVGNVRQYARIVRAVAHDRRIRSLAAEVANNGSSPTLRAELREALDEPAITPGASGRSLTAARFVAVQRPPIRPYVSTTSGRSVLFAQSNGLLVGGPSGVSKSLALFDVLGKLADDTPSTWLGLRVCGGLRVLLVTFEGEGSDEDIAERVAQLVPPGACSRLHVWDRWRLGPAPRADEAGIRALAAEAARVEADVIALDTAPAFFSGGGYDVSKGVPEEAHDALERVRTLARRRLAFAMTQHTRKKDTRAAKALDELEELAGTFVKKVDGAVVIRREGEDRGPRRRVTFAKVRKGPDLDSIVATLPGQDSDDPPRLTLVADLGGAHVKEGTEAEAMAAWIRQHDEPVAAAVLRVRFGISEKTLQRRAPELEALGIKRGRKPGAGNAYAYGAEEQWIRLLGERLGDGSEGS